MQSNLNHKDTELLCSFFVVTRNGPALLRMSVCEKLELLIVNCTAFNASWKKGLINEQYREGVLCKQILKINWLTEFQAPERKQTWQPVLRCKGNAQ